MFIQSTMLAYFSLFQFTSLSKELSNCNFKRVVSKCYSNFKSYYCILFLEFLGNRCRSDNAINHRKFIGMKDKISVCFTKYLLIPQKEALNHNLQILQGEEALSHTSNNVQLYASLIKSNLCIFQFNNYYYTSITKK